jgi:RimJ/RimL family protein N-acetyltransferase
MIRPLTPSDTPAYIALRREMLADSPWAFAGSEDDDEALKPEVTTARIRGPHQAIFGVFEDSGPNSPADLEHAGTQGPQSLSSPTPRLLGAAGLFISHHKKMAHRANIWGVYITPPARNRGLATQLLHATLDHARTWPGVNSAYLSVSENSPQAQRLYERLGFKPWGREPAALITGARAYDEIPMGAWL